MPTIKQLVPIDATSISGVPIDPIQAVYLGNSGEPGGTVVANTLLTVNANKDIGSVRNIESTGTAIFQDITLGGTLTGGTISGVSFSGITFTGTTTINDVIQGTNIDTDLSSVITDSLPSSQAAVDYADAAAAAMLTNPAFTGTTHMSRTHNFNSVNTVENVLSWASYNRAQRTPQFNNVNYHFNTSPAGSTHLQLLIIINGSYIVQLNSVAYWEDNININTEPFESGDRILVNIYYNGSQYYASYRVYK